MVWMKEDQFLILLQIKMVNSFLDLYVLIVYMKSKYGLTELNIVKYVLHVNMKENA